MHVLKPQTAYLNITVNISRILNLREQETTLVSSSYFLYFVSQQSQRNASPLIADCICLPFCKHHCQGGLPSQGKGRWTKNAGDGNNQSRYTDQVRLDRALGFHQWTTHTGPGSLMKQLMRNIASLISETTCCLHPLHINFKEDLGLDYIIEPKSFEANYCLGNCKDDISLPAVFEFYKRLPSDHPASSIRPRCIPCSIDHYLPVLLLYEGHI